ncbi:hypothetical protein K525DRAFT_213579, partial [Schizophyllum commune Loenen D]
SHTFTCYNKGCTKKIRRYQDTGDRSSTSNLMRHATSCWGAEALSIAQEHGTAKAARSAVTTPMSRSGDIKLAFERQGKGKVTYSTRSHTKTEARCSFRPFAVVEDKGYKRLMKTGRPECYIPSRLTVSCGVKSTFVTMRARLGKFLQEHHGELKFVTDCWTSPNHKAYMGTTVTLEHKGSMLTFVLDVVEVP